MYRIELKPGEETVFRTIEELATGIRHGLVTPKARIFHIASQKWLPIEFHPHYKKALNMPATKSGETPAVVVPAEPAPVVMAAPVVVPTIVVARAVVSPVAFLPPVAYDPPMVEEVHFPTEHVPLDPPDAGRFRPLHLAIAAAVLLVVSYLALSAAAPSRMASAAVAADSLPPKPTTSVAVRTSGPTFGPPASSPWLIGEHAANVIARKRTIVTSIGASPPAPAPRDSAVAIEPAPADVDLSVPPLPFGDSLTPKAQTDSNAIRRILRAVSGQGAPAPRP